MVYRNSKWIVYSLSIICLASVVGCSNNSDVSHDSANTVAESSHVYDYRTPQAILTEIQSSVASGNLETALKDYRILESVDKDSVMRTAQARDWIKEKYLLSGDIESAIKLYDNVTDALILPEKEKLIAGKKELDEAILLESQKKYELAAQKFQHLSSAYKIPMDSFFRQRYEANTIELFKTMIREKRYSEAYDLSYSVRENFEVERLSNYLHAKQVFNDGDKKWAILILEDGIRGYSGEFAKEIDDFKLSLKPREYWNGIEIEYNQAEERRNKVNPAIGMSESELRNSRWGEPKEINKTTTAYGTSEQWVYSGNKYVYLDNGVVTAIQE